jgi:hypothetical protein
LRSVKWLCLGSWTRNAAAETRQKLKPSTAHYSLSTGKQQRFLTEPGRAPFYEQ